MNITSDVAAFLGVALADAKATNFAELWCPVMGSVTADVRKPSMSLGRAIVVRLCTFRPSPYTDECPLSGVART